MKKITSKSTNGETNEQQTNNKQITTNNNDNNIKNEKNINNNIAVAEIIKAYEENIGMITPVISDLLLSYLDNMSYELIVEAIKIATVQNKRSSAYIKGILKDWQRKGYKVLADVKENVKEKKKTNYQNYDQREITNFDDLYAN